MGAGVSFYYAKYAFVLPRLHRTYLYTTRKEINARRQDQAASGKRSTVQHECTSDRLGLFLTITGYSHECSLAQGTIVSRKVRQAYPALRPAREAKASLHHTHLIPQAKLSDLIRRHSPSHI